MIRLVVDASVATKWLFEEAGSSEAAQLRTASYDLVAPDLMPLEVANVIWKRVRQGKLPIESGRRALRAFRSAPVRMRRTRSLVDAAWEIAVQRDRTVYDSLYLALAIAVGAPLVTADRRFYDSIARSDLCGHVLWIENLPGESG
jgi:predicted nucleic acid-binding protein